MPLSLARIGEKGYIQKITGSDEIRKHLAALGFIVGGEVGVVSKIGENMILSVKNSRIALDKSMVNRILI